MNKEKILENIIKVLVCIYAFITVFPGGSIKILVFASFGLIMLLLLIRDRKEFVTFFIKPNILMYSIYAWLLLNFIFAFTDYAPQLKLYLNSNIRIVFTVILFIYLAKTKRKNTLKTLAIFSIILIVIINIWTIIANYRQYNVSRLLSTGLVENTQLGVGSYVYIYGLTFFVIMLIYLILNTKDKKIKYLSIALIILCLFTIYKAEFMISMILIIMGVMLIIFKITNLKKLAIFAIIFISVIVIVSPIIGKVCEILGEKSQNYNLQLRFNDIAELLLNHSIENTTDIKGRIEVYSKSFKLFIEHPILGNGFKDTTELGAHSMILDELAKYGILGNIPFAVMIHSICSSTMKCFDNKKQKSIYFICLTIFFAFALINTAMYVTIFYFMFVLVPTIIYLYVKDDEPAKKLENVEKT